MNCKIKIKNQSLVNVLGADEFESFAEFESAVPVGTELLVSDKAGHFVVKFEKFIFSGDKLKVSYRDATGKGQATVEEVIGRVSKDLLLANEEGLDAIAKARLVEIPADVPPVDTVGQMEAIYDPSDSKIKFEQFESTTGQDVKNDFEGTLDDRPSTLAKMALRQAVADTPWKFRYFIVADTEEYFNEEGIAPTGEVLLVVHSAAYESLQAELGRTPTQKEMSEVAVHMTGDKITADGAIYTLPMEGGLGEESDTSFFNRNHDERVIIYADKYGVSVGEAEAHFLQGSERMRVAREKARTAPLEVKVTSVSQGSPVNRPMDSEDFVSKHKLTKVGYSVGLSQSKVKGRVYLSGVTPAGDVVEMLTVPKGINELYGAEMVWNAYQGSTEEEIGFLESLFGTNARKNGPYMSNGVLKYKGSAVTSQEQLEDILALNDWPMLTNKVKEGTSVLYDGGFISVSNDEFIARHTNTDGDLWTHRGKPVPYPANRYLYLNVNVEAPVQKVSTVQEVQQRAIGELFRDPREYDRISLSNELKDLNIKLMLPQFFTKGFRRSISYGRLRKGAKINPPVEGDMAIPYPVGGRYFGSKAVAKRKMNDLLVSYVEAGLPLPFDATGDVFALFDQYITNRVQQAIEAGIELKTFESLPSALYTHYSNAFVAEAETRLLGLTGGNSGTFGEVSPSYWAQQSETSSAQESLTDRPFTPSPVVRVLNSDSNYITIDAFRTLSKANGTWTDAMEAMFLSDKATDTQVVTLAYDGPSRVEVAPTGEVATFTQTSLPETTFTIVSTDTEIGRQMLSEGYGIATSTMEGSVSLLHFYSPVAVSEDRFLEQLESTPVKAIANSEEYTYAINLLGKNFAQKLFSTGQPVTFADIERHRADLGKPFSFTKFLPKKDLSVSKNSADKILEGTKTITLRNADARYSNKSGLVEIEGEIFDFQEIGNLDFEKALAMTGMTQQEFAKAFFGEDKGIESVFDESVKAFFDGTGTRRVYTIQKLGEPVDPRKRKSKKKPIPC